MTELLRGAQFDTEPEGCFRVLEHFQGNSAPMGVETVFPFQLKHRPRTVQSIQLFAGELPEGAGQLQRYGVDWDIDLNARQIRWLATARKGLSSTSTITVRYWRRRPVDEVLITLGLE